MPTAVGSGGLGKRAGTSSDFWCKICKELHAVSQVMSGVMKNHHGWSPALMQLVGDVVPPVLSHVLRNRRVRVCVWPAGFCVFFHAWREAVDACAAGVCG